MLEADQYAKYILFDKLNFNGHCFDGSGPILSDTLTALENWVENNQAPEAIPAFTMDLPTSGQVKSTRCDLHATVKSQHAECVTIPF